MQDLSNLEELVKEMIFKELKLQETVPVEHLEDTPKRIAKMFVNELFAGCYTKPPKITVFSNTSENHQIISVRDITVKSVCSHHFMPFFGTMNIAYIPDEHLVGLSKFARVAHYFGARPQVQELLTKQIAEYLNEKVHPIAIGVKLHCKHLCMIHRGVKSPGSMVTKYIIGGDDNTKKKISKEIS